MFDDPAIAALLNPVTIGVIWLGGFLGAVASGGFGFAFAVVASSVWLHVLNPLQTTFVIVACSVLLQFGTVWPLLPHVNYSRLWPFVVAGLAGIPIGVHTLARTDPAYVKMGLGAFLAVFGLYALISPRIHRIDGGGRVADALVGFIAGMMGGVGGFSGVLPTIWTQLRGWNKTEARAVYQPFIIVMQLATLIMVGLVASDRASLVLLLIALPPIIVGGFAGWRLYTWLNEHRFRQFLAVLLIVSGLALVL